MQGRFAQLSDPHLTTLANVPGRDLWSKRALSYLSWRRKRRFEHRREVLDALQHDLPMAELDQLLVTGFRRARGRCTGPHFGARQQQRQQDKYAKCQEVWLRTCRLFLARRSFHAFPGC